MIRNGLSSIFKSLTLANESAVQNFTRPIFTSITSLREVVDRKEMLRSVPAVDEGTAGEKNIAIDTLIDSKKQTFPSANSENKLFNGVPFKDIPIVNIRVTHNNTVMTFTDAKGVPKLIRSCGIEGYKNTRKGTNIAAQATAITLGTKTLERGIKMVRVRVRGLGPGRISAIKGLHMAGLNIVSITDSTRVSWTPLRARKQRKL